MQLYNFILQTRNCKINTGYKIEIILCLCIDAESLTSAH